MLSGAEVGEAVTNFFVKVAAGFLIIAIAGTLIWRGYHNHVEAQAVEAANKSPVVSYGIDRGTIKAISGCKPLKWVTTCKVITTNGAVFETNLAVWPENYLAPGNHISSRIFTRGRTQMTYNCRDNLCEIVNTCRADKCFNSTAALGNKL